ncbi:MAG: sigma-54-dependent Fis family transcriptional regulator, partial [Candidatus Krumholzibacteriota bacterium]|nr:sigma-54-dependent Fis family transcriptional regulator [Candidatus Krumholzibacteriota bacterium]
PATLERLARQSWPGNVRELRNQVERLLIMSRGETVEPSDLPAAPGGGAAAAPRDLEAALAELAERLRGEPLRESRRRFERALVRLALERHGGNVTRAARDLGLERTNLHKKIRQLGLAADPASGGEAGDD